MEKVWAVLILSAIAIIIGSSPADHKQQVKHQTTEQGKGKKKKKKKHKLKKATSPEHGKRAARYKEARYSSNKRKVYRQIRTNLGDSCSWCNNPSTLVHHTSYLYLGLIPTRWFEVGGIALFPLCNNCHHPHFHARSRWRKYPEPFDWWDHQTFLPWFRLFCRYWRKRVFW